MRIVALFSIDPTKIDQPDHNLVTFSDKEPDLKPLAKALGYDLGKASSDDVLALVRLWRNKAARLGGVVYWWDWIDNTAPLPEPPAGYADL